MTRGIRGCPLPASLRTLLEILVRSAWIIFLCSWQARGADLKVEPAPDRCQLASPDGKVVLSFELADFEGAKACPVYSVRYNSRLMMAPSRIGLDLENQSLQSGLRQVRVSQRTADNIWTPVCGERSQVRDHYNEALIELEQVDAPHLRLNLVLRAYDQGAAFCYTIPEQSSLSEVKGLHEKTEFRLAADCPAWATYSAQGVYTNVPVSQIRSGCERPLVLRVADDCYAALAEARLVDYARAKFGPLAGAAHALVTELGSAVSTKLPLRTPWRVILLGATPGQLLENNDLLRNLNDPCALADTSWIKPGKVIREVTLTTIGGKACVDFAVKHNLQYVEFDAGWYGPENDEASDARQVHVDPKRSKGPLDLREVIRYARERGIGIILYVNRRALERQLDELLPLYQKWGVKGIKFGFVQVGSQRWTTWLHDAIKKAADFHLMVDVHDEYRPTGWSRTYPNLMTQEGIRGDEERQPNEQCLTTLFTRMLAGAADGTICYYDRRVDLQSSHAYQLAKAVCFFSPWQFLYWYDQPYSSPSHVGGAGNAETAIGNEPELEFFDRCPTIWDDTKVLQGQIGEYAVVARRHGQEWFIGAMNTAQARSLQLPLTFLQPGTSYTAHACVDDPAVPTRTHVRVEEHTVNRETILRVSLPSRGGQAWWLVPGL